MQWLFIIILPIYGFVAITNPDIIWEMEHRRFVDGGDPTEWSIKAIVFSGWAAIIIAAVLLIFTIVFPGFNITKGVFI